MHNSTVSELTSRESVRKKMAQLPSKGSAFNKDEKCSLIAYLFASRNDLIKSITKLAHTKAIGTPMNPQAGIRIKINAKFSPPAARDEYNTMFTSLYDIKMVATKPAYAIKNE